MEGKTDAWDEFTKKLLQKEVTLGEKNEELISSVLQRVEQSLKFRIWKWDHRCL